MKRSLLLSLIALLCVSCSDETQLPGPQRPDDAVPLTIYTTIGRANRAVSRAGRIQDEDRWTYTDPFTNGDQIGFYASGGNWQEENGPFDNFQLTYAGNNFSSPDGVEFSPSAMVGSQTFMYFPYTANMGDPGLTLRTTDYEPDEPGAEQIARCIDFLYSNEVTVFGSEGALYGAVDHAFSMLIIMRGEGFDDPPTGREAIKVVLREPFTHVRAKLSEAGAPWSCVPDLYYNGADTEAAKLAAREWYAWKGGNFQITTEDEDGQEAWYVVLPTIGCEQTNDGRVKKRNGFRSTVEYIELYDNEGNLQRVSGLSLSGGNSKYLDGGWRYPMIISMKELVPTVNPFDIRPWGTDVDLTDERARGIHNEVEFADWVRAYNAYLEHPSESELNNTLLRYGDLSMVEGDESSRLWHFYLLADLDFTNYTPYPEGDDPDEPESSVIIPKFQDILDGVSTTLVGSRFTNHTIAGLTKPFVGTLTGNGTLQNFDFVEPDVKDPASVDPAGLIVNIMENGTSVIHCNIDNGTLFHPAGPAGMVAGSVTGGTIKRCTVSGSLMAREVIAGDGAKIAGAVSGSTTFEENDADAVITNN